MNKSLVRRIRKIETQTTIPRWRVVVKDYDGLYRGECGEGLSQEQFEVWVKQQEKDTQIIIVEVCENTPPNTPAEKNVTFKIENYADKNLQDTLKKYKEAVEKASESNIPAVAIEEYSEQEKNAILEAHRIIREHHPAQTQQSMY